jgi:putative DNA primase/helicase
MKIGSKQMFDSIQQFTEALKSQGFSPTLPIISDGKFHRFSTNGKQSDKAGWYIYQHDEIPWGAFGCHRSDIRVGWRANIGREFTNSEKAAFLSKKFLFEDRLKDEALSQGFEYQPDFRGFLEDLELAISHEYLTTKRVKAYGIKIQQNQLIIPMYRSGDIVGYQSINSNGEKKFAKGVKPKGCYFLIGEIKDIATICFCEGYATGASVYEATQYPTVISFGADNLKLVGQFFRHKYQASRLIFCGDDDWKRESNVGVIKATESALLNGGLVAIPYFGESRTENMTDFNDMHQLHGLNAVKEVIDEAKTPTQGGLINNWSEPTALPSMPYVAPFDYELLPDALRGWIQDISENMQSPPDFSAVGAIVTLSSLIGARVKIAPKVNADWFVCPNLWGMIVGRSSAKKTPSLEPVLKPLYKMQLIESERMKEALREWEIESTFHELSIKGGQEKAKQRIKNGDSTKAKSFLVFDDPPPKPNERRFVVNDSTVEKLGEILSQNTWGTLCFRDELYGLLKSMDKQGQEGSRAFYLTSYNGSEPYTFDRIIRGTVTISRVCLSLLGGIQPSRLQEYITGAINGGAGDDGLLQRFGLAVYPDMKPNFEYIDRQPNLQAIEDAYEVFNRLALLEPNEEVPWRFDDESQSIFVDWLTDLEQTVRSDEMHPAMESHLLKYEKLIPSLALIFTLIDNPNPDQKIAKTELVRALAWDEYLRTHAERIYHSANTSSVTGSKRILSEIGKGKVHDGFTAREIAIRNWSGLDNVESVNLSLEVLVDHGYLKTLTTKSPLGGRESTKYIINPMIPVRNEKK